ncbi:MAG: hypothetical protein MAG453_01279 [Calditrichaeota bacterium]|nr:hypothetical protein [Calditrichota bacterium]
MTRNRSATLRVLVLLAGGVAIAAFAFGGAAGSLIFPHDFHVEVVEMVCEDCHTGVIDLPEDGRSRLGHDTCSTCHDVEDDDNCALCHEGGVYEPAAGRAGEFAGFAHNRHQALDCDQCHGDVVAAGAPAFPGSEDCRACHETYEAEPATHRMSTWLHDHGLDAQVSDAECAACHTQASCDDCHQGENILAGTPHPPEWKHTHYAETMYGQECMVCHETRSFCTDCHRSTVPRPHPLGSEFANPETGGTHVEEAESFMITCLSCHEVETGDPVCARCHK